MEKKRLKDDFSTQKEWIAKMGTHEMENFIIGGVIYDKETLKGRRVFTLRSARKYDLVSLRAALNYTVISDDVDFFDNEKNVHSIQNILKALEEKTPPPTKEQEEAVERYLIEFKKKYPEFWNEQERER